MVNLLTFALPVNICQWLTRLYSRSLTDYIGKEIFYHTSNCYINTYINLIQFSLLLYVYCRWGCSGFPSALDIRSGLRQSSPISGHGRRKGISQLWFHRIGKCWYARQFLLTHRVMARVPLVILVWSTNTIITELNGKLYLAIKSISKIKYQNKFQKFQFYT